MATAPKTRTAKAAEKATQKATEAVEAATEMAQDAMEAALNYPKFEVPEVVRSFAEQSMASTRETYARVKTAAEEATDILEDSLETNRKAVHEAQIKALDMAKANTDASFALMRDLLAVNSVSDALQLQTAFARGRFEAFMGYSKELQEMASKAGADAGKPVKAMFDKTFSFGKAA